MPYPFSIHRRLTVLALLFAATAPLHGAEPSRLFDLVGEKAFTVAADDDAVVRQMPIDLRPDDITRLFDHVPPSGDLEKSSAPILELPLFGTVKRARVESVDTTLDGRSLVADGGDVVLVWGQGVLFGSVHHDGRAYRLRTVQDGHQVLEEADLRAYPENFDDALDPAAFADSLGIAMDENTMGAENMDLTKDSGDEIDLMVLYTPAARSSYGTVGIRQLIQLGVAETNTALGQSGVVPRLRLVYLDEIAYSENGDIFDHLGRITAKSDGSMDQVHGLRNQVGADLVKLVGVDVEGGCGVAWTLGPSRNASFESLAFSYTAARCISPNYTFGHELGHNMGCLHAPEDPTNNDGAFPYSFGYKDPGEAFRTLMAYDCDGGCTRRLRWSNPRQSLDGRPLGTADQDNARSLNGVRALVANFRQRRQAAGVLGWESDAVSVDERDGTLTLKIERSDGAVGAVQVSWRLEPIDAEIGIDVADVAGTVFWANGEGAAKTVDIPILDDSTIEGSERFRVVLHNPSGGAELGRAAAEITLLDDDVEPFTCEPSGDRLCLGRGGRFEVTVTWQGADDTVGNGHVVPGSTANSGLLWFFDEANWELLLKVLEGCGFNDHFWVLFAATTDVGYELRITDSQAGRYRVYTNEPGIASPSVNDLEAFPCS